MAHRTANRRQPRAVSNYGRLAVFLIPFLLGTAGAMYTWGKLHRMKQIRGFEPGARIERATVRAKWHDPPDTWWLTWTDRDIRWPGNHRLNLPQAVWSRYSVGDEIEIVYVPGDDSP